MASFIDRVAISHAHSYAAFNTHTQTHGPFHVRTIWGWTRAHQSCIAQLTCVRSSAAASGVERKRRRMHACPQTFAKREVSGLNSHDRREGEDEGGDERRRVALAFLRPEWRWAVRCLRIILHHQSCLLAKRARNYFVRTNLIYSKFIYTYMRICAIHNDCATCWDRT